MTPQTIHYPVLTTPPPGCKSSKVIWMILAEPPPQPLCFDTVDDWQTYLCSLHESGEKITRMQDTGKFAGKRTVRQVFARIDYCADCAIGGKRQLKMQSDRRCILPPGYVPPARVYLDEPLEHILEPEPTQAIGFPTHDLEG